MSGFAYRKNLDGSSQAPTVMWVDGKDSVTFQVGDLVRINTSGNVDVVDATEHIAGVCVGVVTSKGAPVAPDSGTTDTWTLGSSNTHLVGFIPALPNYLFYNDCGTNSLAATNVHQYFDVTDHNNVNFASATDTATAQVRLIELDPDHDGDTSKGLWQVVESQFAQIAVTNAA